MSFLTLQADHDLPAVLPWLLKEEEDSNSRVVFNEAGVTDSEFRLDAP